MNKVRETVVSIGAPVDKNVIWIDVSGIEPIQKVFLNGKWKPLKDADVEAEFHGGQKVSDITLVETSTGSLDVNNKKIASVSKVNEILTDYHERTTDKALESGGIALYNADKNLEYVCTTPPSQIVLQKDRDSSTDSITTIRFTSVNDTPTTTLVYNPNHIKWANIDTYPEIEANTEYLIAIWDCIAVVTKLNTISNSD